MNTVASNYQNLKQTKDTVNLSKIKPALHNNYPANLNSSLYIFKNPLQPILEDYITEYVETTQHDLNESIN